MAKMTKNKELLMIPGPTPVADEVYEALASETYAHTDPRFVGVYREALEMTAQMLGCKDEVYILCGSGTLAMEVAIVNTVKAGEKLLVLSQGYFGDRFIQLAEAFDIQVTCLKSEWGKQVDPAAVSAALAEGGFKAVTITHVDTSTGVIADLDSLVPIIKASGALAIVDGVCATAAVCEDMSHGYGQDNAKIDVLLTGSQKAIGCPPGLAIIAFGEEALKAREALGKIPAYYADINLWRPIMDFPGRYFATPAVNMINAYHAAMSLVMEETLPVRYQRHAAYGCAVRAALQVYGMKPLAEEAIAAPTLTCLYYPEGVDDAAFRSALAAKGVVIAGALAGLAGKAFRIGHMGNTTPEMLRKTIELLGETLNEIGYACDTAAALACFDSTIQA